MLRFLRIVICWSIWWWTIGVRSVCPAIVVIYAEWDLVYSASILELSYIRGIWSLTESALLNFEVNLIFQIGLVDVVLTTENLHTSAQLSF
jgi:hypothetical protein